MSQPLTEKPNAEQVPFSASAAVILDGRYLPPPQDKDGKIWARTSAIVQANADELYALWRDVESAPKWQEQITSVRQTSDVTSHWIMESDGEKIEWDSEILADEPGKRITWRSIAGDSSNAGEVIFDAAQETEEPWLRFCRSFASERSLTPGRRLSDAIQNNL